MQLAKGRGGKIVEFIMHSDVGSASAADFNERPSLDFAGLVTVAGIEIIAQLNQPELSL